MKNNLNMLCVFQISHKDTQSRVAANLNPLFEVSSLDEVETSIPHNPQ